MDQTGTKGMETQSDQYLRLINHMLTEKTFNKSAEFLRSVRDNIKSTNKITAGQIRAVNNIYIKFSEKG
jgi:hypothetical protein